MFFSSAKQRYILCRRILTLRSFCLLRSFYRVNIIVSFKGNFISENTPEVPHSNTNISHKISCNFYTSPIPLRLLSTPQILLLRCKLIALLHLRVNHLHTLYLQSERCEARGVRWKQTSAEEVCNTSRCRIRHRVAREDFQTLLLFAALLDRRMPGH